MARPATRDKANHRPHDRFVYKIFGSSDWLLFQHDSIFYGNEDDLKDGYIHLSTASQIEGTLQKHFSDLQVVVIARLDSQRLGTDLKWESSRHKQIFPHLYAPLKSEAMVARTVLVADDNTGYPTPKKFLLTS